MTSSLNQVKVGNISKYINMMREVQGSWLCGYYFVDLVKMKLFASIIIFYFYL